MGGKEQACFFPPLLSVAAVWNYSGIGGIKNRLLQ